MDIAKTELRNGTMHLTNAECNNPNFGFPEVKDCKVWNEVLNKFVNTLEDIVTYLYSTNYITSKIKDEIDLKIQNIQNGKALYETFEKAAEKLLNSEREYEYLQEKVAENTTAIQYNTNKIQQTSKETQQNTQMIQQIKKETQEMKKDIHDVKSMNYVPNGKSLFKIFTVPILFLQYLLPTRAYLP